MSSQYLVYKAELQQTEQRSADLKQRMKELMDQERPAAIAEVTAILEKYAEFNLKPVELGLTAPKQPRMIYHDPVANKTWNGKGSKPKWVMNAAPGSLLITPAKTDRASSTSATSAV